ncbi:MAG: metallophosphoesterase [Intestinibacter bartlettii]
MMRIGIISDTHRFTKAIDHVIPYLQDCDLIVHAGDNIDDADYIEAVTDIPVVAVKGNCDFYSDPGKDEETFMAEDKRVFVCHGHNYGIKYSMSDLLNKALNSNIDIVIFGHSHIPFYQEIRGVIFINPGSVSLPRGGSSKGLGILDIENGEITYERIEI